MTSGNPVAWSGVGAVRPGVRSPRNDYLLRIGLAEPSREAPTRWKQRFGKRLPAPERVTALHIQEISRRIKQADDVDELPELANSGSAPANGTTGRVRARGLHPRPSGLVPH
jgi:hypothetical protein